MDLDGDGFATKDEFMKGCLQDDELLSILACYGSQNQPKKSPNLKLENIHGRRKSTMLLILVGDEGFKLL